MQTAKSIRGRHLVTGAETLSRILDIFFKAGGTRPLLVLFCLFLGGVAEGMGLASLLPLLSIALDETEEAPSGSASTITEWLAAIGIEPNLATLVAFVVTMIVLKSILSMTAMKYVGYTVANITTNIRRDLVNDLLAARWSFFTKLPLGRITNALSGEASRAGQAYLATANVLVYGMQAAVYTLVALFISWQAALAAVFVGITIAVALGFLIRRSKKAGVNQTNFTRDFITYLSDTLNNIKPLKAMSRQDDFARLLDKNISKLRQALRKQVLAKEGLKAANESLAAIVIGFGFVVSIVYFGFPPAELAVMGLVLLQLVKTISKIQTQYQVAVICESAYYSMINQIEETAAAREPDPSSETPMFEQSCRFEDVRFAHSQTPVLQGVSLEFIKDTTTVLTGPSGSGKTTITDILLGFYAADSGRVLIDDRPLSDFSLGQWRAMIGYVPQEPILFHDTVYANIALGNAEISEDVVREALRLAGALDFVESMPQGVHSEVGEKGALISGGQRQRIAIARALVGRPRILILDEVTSALDPASEQEILRNIRSLAGQVTVIAITHRPAFLEIADRVYRLEAGKVLSES